VHCPVSCRIADLDPVWMMPPSRSLYLLALIAILGVLLAARTDDASPVVDERGESHAVLTDLLMVEEERAPSLLLQLPTSNDGLLQGDRSQFYQRLDRDRIPGLRASGWEGGQYGFVRNEGRTPAGPIFTRVHQGVDIRPLYRDRTGVPLDTVRAISDGTVVFANRNANGSNYGRYVVLRHQWDGSDVYTLSAHLSTVAVANGAEVEAGAPLGRMGYTGRGLNRARAHLHLEVAMMLNQHYQRWHQAFYGSRDHRGVYFPRNLMGLNPSALFLALQEEPHVSFAEFVRRQPVAYRLALPGDRPLDVLERYAWLGVEGVSSEDTGASGAWLVGFTREGVPVEIARQDRPVSQPEVAYVSDEVRRGHLSTNGFLSRTSSGGYQLTREGRAHAALLATTSSSVPRWF
jgi:murein DD-endopeptidase MepM/ murein hydrolase activator NlpD